MPLHHLHYAIQRLFGWQNSHLRRFILPEETYSSLTGETVKGWSDWVGILFQAPSEHEKDYFWDDDYISGSIKTWLRKKYTWPYVFRGRTENYEWAQKDVKEFLESFPMIEVKEDMSEKHPTRWFCRERVCKNPISKSRSDVILLLDEDSILVILLFSSRVAV